MKCFMSIRTAKVIAVIISLMVLCLLPNHHNFSYVSANMIAEFLNTDKTLESELMSQGLSESVPTHQSDVATTSKLNTASTSKPETKSGPPRLLIMILSAPTPKNFDLRQCVRESYLTLVSEAYEERFEYFFLVGSVQNTTMDDQIATESETYHDMVKYEGPEDYNRLSTKVIWGLNYIAQNFKHKIFDVVLKTDDDAFINVAGMIRALERVQSQGENLDRFYGGDVLKARRHTQPKFASLYSEGFIRPRKYCAGHGYFLGRSLLARIPSLPDGPLPCEVEDVYVGYLVQEAGVTPTRIDGIRVWVGWKEYPETLMVHRMKCSYMRMYANKFRNTPERLRLF